MAPELATTGASGRKASALTGTFSRTRTGTGTLEMTKLLAPLVAVAGGSVGSLMCWGGDEGSGTDLVGASGCFGAEIPADELLLWAGEDREERAVLSARDVAQPVNKSESAVRSRAR